VTPTTSTPTADLRAYLDGEPTRAPTLSTLDPTVRSSKKEFRMFLLSALSLLNGVFLSAAEVPSPGARPSLSFGEAEPYPAMNALFELNQGWIGADGAHSVDLSSRRLWLFSDTWVGQVRAGKRCDAVIVNNSVGLQEGTGATSKMRFAVRRNADKKAAALFTPSDGRGWFWLQAGAYVDNHLYVFLSQVEKTDKPGPFGFRQIGQSLGVVPNPDDDPTSWRCEQLKLPCTIFSPERELTFGAAVLRDRDYLYIYGTDEAVKPTQRDRYLIVARVGLAHIKDFTAWRFYDGAGWSADFNTSKRMVSGMASEGSVSYLPDVKQYVLVYTDGGLSERILARTAPGPTGPWSAPAVLYRCPEAGRDKRIFCYGAKAHPTLARGNELVVSYVANSFDFWQVAADATIYLPRFILVKYRKRE
jgi:hypothetical protein